MTEATKKKIAESIRKLHQSGKYNYRHMKGNKLRSGKIPWNKGLNVGVRTQTSFKKGNIAWNKGKPGYTTTKRGKTFPALQGENHWNWQGGKTNETMRLRNSSAYKTWRNAVFERDNYICVICGKRGGQLEADHIKQFALFPELRFEVSNGRTLCRNCHLKVPIYAYQGTRKIVRLK